MIICPQFEGPIRCRGGFQTLAVQAVLFQKLLVLFRQLLIKFQILLERVDGRPQTEETGHHGFIHIHSRRDHGPDHLDHFGHGIGLVRIRVQHLRITARNPQALKIHLSPASAPGRDKAEIGGAEGEYKADLPVLGEKLQQSKTLRFTSGPFSARRCEKLEKVGEIDPHVDAAGAVLVETAVPVVVQSFRIKLVDAFFPLGRIGLFHQAGFIGNGHPCPLRILNTHLGDHPVTVEIVGTVLIRRLVHIIIVGPGIPRIHLKRAGKITGRCIRIAGGKDVPGSVFPLFGRIDQRLCQIQCRQPRRGNRPFQIGRHKDGRQGFFRRAGFRADLKEKQVPSSK